MLKGDRKYIFFLSTCFIALLALQLMAPKSINWKLSYLKKDKIPYGTSALYYTLPSLFQNTKIVVKDVPLYNALNDKVFKNTAYIIINDRFEPDKLDVESLKKFVKNGNSAFISANFFSKSFMDSLKFKTGVLPFNLESKAMLNFYNPKLKDRVGYATELTFGKYFTKFDTAAVTVLGDLTGGKINFIRMGYGKGNFYFHTSPEIFLNYNFLKKNNINYSEKVFSYLPVQQLIWDDYYKAGKVHRDRSPLRVIFSYPALSTAYYLLLFSIILFIVIGIKRKQRIIPVMEPFNNTTLEFVETVGALYYQKGSHKEIADKQIIYFMSYVKSTFRVTTSDYDNAFISKLSSLSGIENNKINGLFKYIAYIKAKSEIYEHELLQLNIMIENFYKLNKR